MKRLLSSLLVFAVIISSFTELSIISSAVETQGKCGVDAQYTFYPSTCTLVISGTGELYDFNINNGYYSVFSDLSNIQNVIINEGITHVGDYMFRNKSSITSLSLPKSLTSIGEQAFIRCSITDLFIPENISVIEPDAFAFNTSITVTVSKANRVFNSENDCNAIIQSTTLKVGCCNSTVPDSVKCIGSKAFYGTPISSLVLSSNVKTISEFAFWDCYKLKSIHLDKNLTSIGKSAFSGCSVKDVFLKEPKPSGIRLL